MKRKIIFIIAICLSFANSSPKVLAHPGRTDSNGCHTCHSNCAKWGLSNGEYHCHNGGSTSNTSNIQTPSQSSTSNNVKTVPKEAPKSSDNTLKSISVDGQQIEIADQMNYKTKKEKVEISVETNDAKAKYETPNAELNIGTNTINIKVIAENGDIKNYVLIVEREKLNSNTNINVIANNEEIEFVDDKANIYVSSNTKTLDYKYTLEDKTAKVKITGDNELKYGENIIYFKVTAEDGTTKDYQLTVTRYTKAEETSGMVLGIGTLGAIGYGIYRFMKKRKK